MTAPEQWLPPIPETPAEQMARAITAQAIGDHLARHGLLAESSIANLSRAALEAAENYETALRQHREAKR
jgi:hypothetical protein